MPTKHTTAPPSTVEDLFMEQLYAEHPNRVRADNALENLSNYQLLERISNAIERRLKEMP